MEAESINNNPAQVHNQYIHIAMLQSGYKSGCILFLLTALQKSCRLILLQIENTVEQNSIYVVSGCWMQDKIQEHFDCDKGSMLAKY